MATTLKELTRLGTDARKIARLLQAKAPPGHMLAFINEREAALLKSAGGSGEIDPETGIPSFEDAPPEDFGPPPDFEEAPGYSTEGYAGAADVLTPMGQDYYGAPSDPIEEATFTPRGGVQPVDIMAEGAATRGFPTPTAPTTLPPVEDAQFTPVPSAPATAPSATKGGGLNLGQLGVAGLGALLGARQGRKATAAAQTGAQEMKQLAAPYQQAGQQLQAAAMRGELTPGSQQALQAMQAQLAQGVEARGGVGVAQAQAAIANLRNQLLQQQYDYGLKLSGIGDNIALGAIRTGLEADKYAAQLSQNFYSNLARLAGGAFSPGR